MHRRQGGWLRCEGIASFPVLVSHPSTSYPFYCIDKSIDKSNYNDSLPLLSFKLCQNTPCSFHSQGCFVAAKTVHHQFLTTMSNRRLQQATISFSKSKVSSPVKEPNDPSDDELSLQCPICFQYVITNALLLWNSSKSPSLSNTSKTAC